MRGGKTPQKNLKGGEDRKGEKMTKNFKIVCRASKEGKKYVALVNDLGYRLVYLTFKANDIAEMLNLRLKEYYELYVNTMNVGDEIEVK